MLDYVACYTPECSGGGYENTCIECIRGFNSFEEADNFVHTKRTIPYQTPTSFSTLLCTYRFLPSWWISSRIRFRFYPSLKFTSIIIKNEY